MGLDNVNIDKYTKNRQIDLNSLYERTHSELTLQQTKRDQIIAFYITIMSIFLPLVMSQEGISVQSKGVLFTCLGLLGIILCFIILRYRIYKEVHWVCCQTITQLLNFAIEEIDKDLIQERFKSVFVRKSKRFIYSCEDKYAKTKTYKLSRWIFFKSHIFSAETLHYLIIVLVTSAALGTGVYQMINISLWSTLIGVIVGLAVCVVLLMQYMVRLFDTYRFLTVTKNVTYDEKGENIIREETTQEDKQKETKYFNSAFSKAWFLHFYL